ncbi:MAG: hypothetical protein Q4F05_04000 [bacterium]|nr:hypothetical protein [bacterium]
MAYNNSLSYVYGSYLMSPRISRNTNNVNKNSFGRLINSYYGKHSLFKKTLPCTYSSELLTLNEKTKDIATSLHVLQEKQELYSEEKREELGETLFSFVQEYNSLVEALGECEKDELKEKSYMLEGVSEFYKDDLLSVGIQINEDQTLNIDTDQIDTTDLSVIERLFHGQNSYGMAVMERASQLGKESLSMVSSAPKFYQSTGNINYSVNTGVLFSTYC